MPKKTKTHINKYHLNENDITSEKIKRLYYSFF